MKNRCITITFSILYILYFSIQSIAQEKDIEQFKKLGLDPFKIETESVFSDEDFYLPTIEALIDSALIYSPILKQFDANLEITSLLLKSSKINWTEYISTSADIKYGSTDNVVFTQQASEYSSGINAINTTRYNLGVGVKMNVFDIINRNNKIEIAKFEKDIAEAQRDEPIQIIIQNVTLLYNRVILSQRILVIKSETQQAKLLHFNLAEKQFLSGEIPVSEYSSIIGIIAKSSAEFENAKMDFKNAYFLLQQAVGIKIQNI